MPCFCQLRCAHSVVYASSCCSAGVEGLVVGESKFADGVSFFIDRDLSDHSQRCYFAALILKVATFGRGSCQPLATSPLSMAISFALWPRADLWLPLARLARTSARRYSSAISRRGNSAPSGMRSWMRDQSGCAERSGARSSGGRNWNWATRC